MKWNFQGSPGDSPADIKEQAEAYDHQLRGRGFTAKVIKKRSPAPGRHGPWYQVSYNLPKRNPAGLTKAQRKEKAHKTATERRVAHALANYLRKLNPGKKLVAVAQQKLKGGAVKVRPIFASRNRKKK